MVDKNGRDVSFYFYFFFRTKTAYPPRTRGATFDDAQNKSHNFSAASETHTLAEERTRSKYSAEALWHAGPKRFDVCVCVFFFYV